MAWTIDTAHTEVGFSAKHLGISTVRGRFTRFSGAVDLADPSDPTGARTHVEIDAASLDTGNEQRDQHLRAADFLDVEHHPTITFDLRSVEPADDGEFTVRGDLTIRGVTRPVTLLYQHGGLQTDPFGNTKIGGSVTGTVNRSDWNLNWNVPLGGGGLLVGEKIKLEIDGQLVQARAPVVAEERRGAGSSG